MSKKILIVEDDTSFHSLYEAILDNTGYRAVQAYDGNDALDLQEEEKPDLIILVILLDIVSVFLCDKNILYLFDLIYHFLYSAHLYLKP